MVRYEWIRFIKKKWMAYLILAILAVDIFLMWITINDHTKERWWIKEEKYDYAAYVEEVIYNCNRLMSSADLGSITEFRKNNVRHMLAKYSRLKSLEVSTDITDGIEVSTGETWQLVLQLILVAALSLGVFLPDRGCREVEISTKYGRNRLMLSRLCLLWILVTVTTLIFYGICIGMTWTRIGMGDLSAPIQSWKVFRSCPYIVNGYEYLLWILVIRTLAGCLYAGVFALVINLTGALVPGMILNLIIVAGTYVVYTFIGDASLYVHFRYSSIWTVLNGETFFQNYLCLSFGDYAIPYLYWTALCSCIICMVSSILIVVRAYRPITWKRVTISLPHFGTKNRRTICGIEAYKMFIANKGVLVVLGSVLLICFFNTKDSYWMDENERYYRNYMLRYEGELTQEKEQHIQAEWDRLEMIESEVQKLTERFQNGEIDDYEYEFELSLYQQQMIMRSALSRVRENVESVKRHPNSQLIYDTGLRKFLFEDTLAKKVYFFFGGLIISLLCGGLFALEKEQGTIDLLASTKRGRQERRTVKIAWGLAVALTVALSLSITELVRIARTYRIPNLASIAGNGFETEMFYKLYLVIIVLVVILIKGVVAMGYAGIIMYISERSGRTHIAFIAGILLAFLGLVLKQLGFGIGMFTY